MADQKAIIRTGAWRGIGAGLVKAFLDRRYNVAANSLRIQQVGRVRGVG
jgi:NAD(P)-dependent dehydrogenase (short-subunit alcohol dehydrogenase family)